MLTPMATITRGNLVESWHFGNAAIVNQEGRLVAWAGDPDVRLFFRSSAKPFQAIPLISLGAADAFGLTPEELALVSASHNATGRHQAIVASLLAKAGLTEDDLQCGWAAPLDEKESARILLGEVERSQIQCECSGKHTGMLATCRHMGWSTDNYLDPNHTLQREIRMLIAAAMRVNSESLDMATDGCSLPTYGAPLHGFAAAYALLAHPHNERWDFPAGCRPALLRLRGAIGEHPDLVSGEGEIDTKVMQITRQRVIAKLGAEGLLCMAIPEISVGIAIQAVDGSERGLGPGAVRTLQHLDVLDATVMSELEETLCPVLENFAGRPVGKINAVLDLKGA
jgi:L-asparaginase II